jgi:hypothetical protein
VLEIYTSSGVTQSLVPVQVVMEGGLVLHCRWFYRSLGQSAYPWDMPPYSQYPEAANVNTKLR